MIVTFDPMINSGASYDAAYMNFLRCVTAIATAAAGTTSLTVNPFTNNTGTIDNTKNCIVGILANGEAGGWSTSASHTIVNSGAFTSLATSNTSGTGNKAYVADFYTASGKSAKPYLKMSFTNVGNNYWSVYGSGTINMQATTHTTSLLAPIQMAFGCSTTSDFTDTSYSHIRTVIDSAATTSITLNQVFPSRSASGPWFSGSFAPGPGTSNNVIYTMAVTKDYCIIWEQSKSNSYSAGYSNVIGGVDNYTHLDWSYGSIMYGGLRETHDWENSLNNNPPWTAFQFEHVTKSQPSSKEIIASYMSTMTNTGVPSSTATMYVTNHNTSATNFITTSQSTLSYITGSGTGTMTYNSSGRNYGITNVPVFQSRDISATSLPFILYPPVTDDSTGALVPSAIPIRFERNTSDSWHPGGACRGIYKSMGAPLATMKLYFSEGQTFTINGDPYMPVVFNETMYLVRFK
jgi:hypothetical protein